jgi:hypothetical protein
MNVLGARAGGLDASSFGHQERSRSASPRIPARSLGASPPAARQAGDTTVTLMPVEGVRQLAQQLNGDAEASAHVRDCDEDPSPFPPARAARGS